MRVTNIIRKYKNYSELFLIRNLLFFHKLAEFDPFGNFKVFNYGKKNKLLL